MTSFYEKVTENVSDKVPLSIAQIVAIACISIPGFFIVKDCVGPKVVDKYHHLRDHVVNDTFSTHAPLHEEDILEAKVKSENLRPGPAFLNAHIYHDRRIERVKNAYTNIWSLVNQNLDSGNRCFKVAATDDDVKILNVVKRLLIDELDRDGYTATVSIHPMVSTAEKVFNVSHQDSDADTSKTSDYYFTVNIVE